MNRYIQEKRKLVCFSVLVVMSIVGYAQKEYPSYLNKDDFARAEIYLPAPPDTASNAFIADKYYYVQGKSMRSTPRGVQAVREACLATDSLLSFFTPAFGRQLSEAATPAVYHLIARVETDASNSVASAKRHYMRKRPYVQFGEPTSIPEEEKSHRKSGSYPSGHAAVGWAVALVLAEIKPSCQEAILKCGYEYGESRVIAGYHYRSDVDAARIAASAAVARIHADKKFRKDLKKAKKEVGNR